VRIRGDDPVGLVVSAFFKMDFGVNLRDVFGESAEKGGVDGPTDGRV